jgi:hypothetical protein
MSGADSKRKLAVRLYKAARKILCLALSAVQVCFLSFLLVSLVPAYAQIIFDAGRLSQRMQAVPGQLCDFRMEYALGKMILSSERNLLYDPAAQNAFFKKLFGPDFPTGHTCYAPFFYWFMIPLSAQSQQVALAIWTVSSIALGLSLLVALACFTGMSGWQIPAVVLGTLASYPSFACVAMGQTSYFYLALFCAAIIAFWFRRDCLCGTLTFLAAVKPQYALIMSIPALTGLRWKQLVSAALLALIFCAAAAQYLGWINILKYPYYIATITSTPGLEAAYHTPWTISLRGPLTMLLPWKVATTLGSIIQLAGLALIARIWWQTMQGAPGRKTYQWAWALTIVIGLTTSAHSHLYDCLLLAVAAVLTMPSLNPEKILGFSSIWLRIWSLTLYFYPMLSVLIYVSEKTYFGGFSSVPFAIVQVLLSIAGYLCFQKNLQLLQTGTCKYRI